jgi:glutamate-1-semialdehyde 2,1-aminomutase
MMERGVFLPPSQFEAWFLSTAIDENDMKTIERAIEGSFQAISEKFNQ